MTLPAWNEQNVLPPGNHRAEIDAVYDRFVCDAPHRAHRERLFGAFQVHIQVVREYLPSGATLWIDGGFAMRKDDPPHDVDVCIIPHDWEDVVGWSDEQYDAFLGLITLQNVIIEHPWPSSVPRIQPVGGLLDAFIVPQNESQGMFDTWSCVKLDGRVQPGMVKGFAEVVI